MNATLVVQLALRYFRGKRGGNAVPVLSRISIVAIAIGSAALIILFSVLNGLIFLVQDLYKAFYPDIKISVVHGKFFEPARLPLSGIAHINGVQRITQVIEDNVLANNDDDQIVARLKGIDTNYFRVNNVQPYIIEGSDTVSSYPEATAIMGSHIANQMGAEINKAFTSIVLYYPNTKGVSVVADPSSAFQTLRLKPAGIFRIQYDFDSKYILAPLPLVQDLFREQGRASSVEIAISPQANADDIKKQVRLMVGDAFHVETRYEQNQTLYQVMRAEKWAAYAILLLILVIASFNMIGALSLLVLEKKKDMAILRAMGAQPSSIRLIFLVEGVLWSLTGCGIGLLTGVALCLGQQHFQWIRLDGAFVVSAYPVSMVPSDFLVVIGTVMVIGLLASWYPAFRATNEEAPSLKST